MNSGTIVKISHIRSEQHAANVKTSRIDNLPAIGY